MQHTRCGLYGENGKGGFVSFAGFWRLPQGGRFFIEKCYI